MCVPFEGYTLSPELPLCTTSFSSLRLPLGEQLPLTICSDVSALAQAKKQLKQVNCGLKRGKPQDKKKKKNLSPLSRIPWCHI